jgi:hypothetical protein
MKKSNAARPAAHVMAAPRKNPLRQNANLQRQTRKLLNQHYRAKYGVK